MKPLEQVILALDANKDYHGFWPYVARHWWNKFRIHPVLVRSVRDGGDFAIPDPGVPHTVITVRQPAEIPWGHSLDWRTTLSLLWAAAKHPGGRRVICGIDQILLDPEILRRAEATPEGKIFVGYSDAYSHPAHAQRRPSPFEYHPSAYLAGDAADFDFILKPGDDYAQFCANVWHKRDSWIPMWGSDKHQLYWGLDESYFSCCASWHPNVIVRNDNFFWEHVRPRVIDRGLPGFDGPIDITKLVRAGYSEMHAIRPFEANPPYTLNAIEKFFPEFHYDPSTGGR